MGSLTIVLIVIGLVLGMLKVVNFLCVRYYQHPFARKVGVLVGPYSVVGIVIRDEILAAYLEIVVSAMLCLPDRDYPLPTKAPDLITFTFGVISLALLIFTPLYLWRKLHLNKSSLDEPEF